MRHNHARLLLLALGLLSSVAWASTTWYVNGVSGSDSNNCLSALTACKTIRHAVSLAVSGDSIRVAAATYEESLTISASLRIVGFNANTTIIDGGGAHRVVSISTGAAVTLSNLTVRNGSARNGGGIYNSGTLTVLDTIISGNLATIPCTPPVCIVGGTAAGGGIYNRGTLTINKSTLTGNLSDALCREPCLVKGGGISNSGTLTIINSTLSQNETSAICDLSACSSLGGGINNNGALRISNSTFSGNSAVALNSGHAQGGGINNVGAATLQNSIVANSGSGGNCAGPITSSGYNLSSDNTCNFNKSGDLNNTDPQLGILQNNGGPTQTMALPSGSPAIDAGNPSGCTDGLGHLLKTDQRGKPRPDTEDTSGCDIGAYERQSD
jgi:hypothetical protein